MLVAEGRALHASVGDLGGQEGKADDEKWLEEAGVA
jgi:hypothetical protein